MTSIYETFETDKTLEKEGVWIDYGPFRFLVARAGGSNQRFSRSADVHLKPHRAAQRAGSLPEEVARRVFVEVYADSIILDWQGVTDRDGAPIPFSRDAVVTLLTDLPAVFDDLREQASDFQLFRKEALKIEAGNSEASSTTL